MIYTIESSPIGYNSGVQIAVNCRSSTLLRYAEVILNSQPFTANYLVGAVKLLLPQTLANQ